MISSINLFTKQLSRFTFLFLAVVILIACEKEKKNTNSSTSVISGSGVLIGNEGAFLAGNSSIMYYGIGNDAASADLYSQVNGQPLGDVLQSLFIDGPRLYMMVNNSQKIEVSSLPSFTEAGTLSGLPSPRYMVKVDDEVAFVTNYGSNSVSRISLSSQTVTGSIALPGWSDAILFKNGKLFVTAPAKDKLYVCDPTLMQVTDSIAIGVGGNALVVDKDGMIWAFAAGEFWNTIAGSLVKINPATNQVQTSFDLGMTQGAAGRLCSNGVGDTLYYLNGDVYRMSINNAVLPPSFIPAAGRSLYGLYRHPNKPFLFVSDAKDFSQNGDLYMYSPEGVSQKIIPVGIAPSSILAY